MKRAVILLPIISLLFLFACSKDDDSEKPNSKTDLKGVFTDSPVEGVRYETETKSGYTDVEGQYEYAEGEIVSFFIGEIELGSTLASGELSPISIASTADADIYTKEVQNIAAFLQTLDKDGDPTNGIKIASEVVEAITATEIDFTKNIIQILGEIALEVFQSTGISLKVTYPEIAAAHLAQTIGVEFDTSPSFSLNFLPTFTTYFGRDYGTFVYNNSSIALNWIHEFDENGNLLSSKAYEKYPSRILLEFKFFNYDLSNFKVDVEIKPYSYFSYQEITTDEYTIQMDEDYRIRKILPKENMKIRSFETYNSKNWVKLVKVYDAENVLKVSSTYDYDDEGNLITLKVFGPDGNELSTEEYTYTQFGDPASYSLTRGDTYKNFQYTYRNDNTLEKYVYDFSTGSSSMEFAEDEKYLKWMAIYDDGEKFITHYEIEEKIEEYTYTDDSYNEIFYYLFDGNDYAFNAYKYEYYIAGILRERHLLDSNDFDYITFESFDENGNLEYKDFYDEEGNEVYREYYDESGNVTSTTYY